MIKKPWGVQTDDGREGMMNPNQKTSWHKHSKDTRVKVSGLMYVIVGGEGIEVHKLFGDVAVTIVADTPHCLFTCGEVVTFKESGTEIATDIERLPWPAWLDEIIAGVRNSHRPAGVDLPPIPIEGYGRRDGVSQVTNEADVTTSK